MPLEFVFLLTTLTLFGFSITSQCAGGLDRIADSFPRKVSFDFQLNIRSHGCVALFILGFYLLLIEPLGSNVNYVLSCGLVLVLVGIFDNLLGLLSKRQQYRKKIYIALLNLLICTFFVACLGHLFGNTAYHLPNWFADPFAFLSVLSILKVLNLLKKAYDTE